MTAALRLWDLLTWVTELEPDPELALAAALDLEPEPKPEMKLEVNSVRGKELGLGWEAKVPQDPKSSAAPEGGLRRKRRAWRKGKQGLILYFGWSS